MPPEARRAAAEKPDGIDGIFFLAGAGQWLGLATAGVLLLALLVWGCAGRLHYAVQGMGVVRHRGGVIEDIVAPSAGVVRTLAVTVGSSVRAGDVLARIDVAVDAASEAGAVAAVLAAATDLTREQQAADDEIIRRRRTTESQIEAQRRRVANAQTRQIELGALLQTQTDELRQGYTTRQQVLNTENQLFQAGQTVLDADAQILDLGAQLDSFIDQRQQAVRDADRALGEAQARLAVARARADTDGIVRAGTAGRIAALAMGPGEQIQAGQTLVQMERATGDLDVLAFVPVASGKAVQPGMPVLVSPGYIERAIYGSLLGRVASVSDEAVDASTVRAELGDSDLGRSVTGQGAVLQLVVALDRRPGAADALRWTSAAAPDLPVRAGATAGVQVQTRTIRPVELVAPIAATWLGAGD